MGVFTEKNPNATENYVDDAITSVSGVLQSNINDMPDTFLELKDTPSSYSDSKYLQSTLSGTFWANVLGIPGPKGDDGGEWMSGAGPPPTTTGILNNFYLDTDTGDIYRKTSTTISGVQYSVMVERESDYTYTFADAVRLVKSGQELIIDNEDEASYSTGFWFTFSTGNAWDGTCKYSTTSYGAKTYWNITIPEDGEYDVYAWWPIYANSARTAPFTITHISGTNVVRKDQHLGTPQWNYLATHSFDGEPVWVWQMNIKGEDGVTTFSGLSDTPNVYEDGKFLQSTALGTVWATISGVDGNFVTLDTDQTISGTKTFDGYHDLEFISENSYRSRLKFIKTDDTLLAEMYYINWGIVGSKGTYIKDYSGEFHIDSNAGAGEIFLNGDVTFPTGQVLGFGKNGSFGPLFKIFYQSSNKSVHFDPAIAGFIGSEPDIIIFNETGLDTDIRMEGDTDSNLFYLDAGNDTVTIGGNLSTGKFNVNGTTFLNDKLIFKQIDGNEYINSETDGYLDLNATDGINLKSYTTVSGDLVPATDLMYNLGLPSARWKTLYVGNLGGSTTVSGDFLPALDDTYDLGSAAYHWKYLHVEIIYGNPNDNLQLITSNNRQIRLDSDRDIINMLGDHSGVNFWQIESDIDGVQVRIYSDGQSIFGAENPYESEQFRFMGDMRLEGDLTVSGTLINMDDTAVSINNREWFQIRNSNGDKRFEIGTINNGNPEIRLTDAGATNTRIGFPASDPTYFAFINDYSEFWLGISGDQTLYFNYYSGDAEYHGTTINRQKVDYFVGTGINGFTINGDLNITGDVDLGGDTFFNDNTISGTGDIYAGNLYGNGSNITGLTLDDAYSNDSVERTVLVDNGSVSWDLTGANNFIVDMQGTGYFEIQDASAPIFRIDSNGFISSISLYVYSPALRYIQMDHDDTNGFILTSFGGLQLNPAGANVEVLKNLTVSGTSTFADTIDANSNEIINIDYVSFDDLSADPSTPTDGDVWYRDDNNFKAETNSLTHEIQLVQIIQCYSTVVQDLNQATPQAVQWNNEDFKDSFFIHSNVTNNSRITVNSDCLCEVSYNISLDNASISRNTVRVRIRVNGATYISRGTTTSYSRNTTDDKQSNQVNLFWSFNSGDYFEILGDQQGTAGVGNTIANESHVYVKLLRYT